MSAYTPRDIAGAVQLATHFAKSGLLGELNTPEKVMLVMATGAELGIPPTTALRSIHIIKGKPVCSADLIMSLCIRRKDRCEYFSVVESTDAQAVYETKPVGRPPVRSAFTMVDAKRAGLSFKEDSNWSKYPRAMLRHRASSELARMVYPDLVLGIYSEEEVERDVIDEPVVQLESYTAPEQPKVDRGEEAIGALMDATTLEDLKKAAAAMSSAGATEAQRAQGRQIYKERAAALAAKPEREAGSDDQ